MDYTYFITLAVQGRKEMFYLTTHSTQYTVIWRRLYRKAPFRQRERKPVADTSSPSLSVTDRFIHYTTVRTVHTAVFVTPSCGA